MGRRELRDGVVDVPAVVAVRARPAEEIPTRATGESRASSLADAPVCRGAGGGTNQPSSATAGDVASTLAIPDGEDSGCFRFEPSPIEGLRLVVVELETHAVVDLVSSRVMWSL